MRTWMGAVVLAGLVGLLSGPAALAQPGGNRGPGAVGGFGGGNRALRDAVGKLGLTEDQKKLVEDAIKKAEDAAQADRESNRAEMQKLMQDMRAARQANDEAKTRELQDQMQKLFQGRSTAAVDQVKAILTDEQKKKLDTLLAEARTTTGFGLGQVNRTAQAEQALRNADQLGLTEEQKARLNDALKAYREAEAKAGEALNKAVTDTLTKDQQDKLRTLRPAGFAFGGGQGQGGRLDRALGGLGLTDDQKRNVDELRKAYDDARRTARPEDVRSLSDKLNSDIKSVLTEEQKKKFEDALQGGGRGSGAGGGGTTPGDATRRGGNRGTGNRGAGNRGAGVGTNVN